MAEIQTLPAGRGAAIAVRKGESLKIINTTGMQVVDTWAFKLEKPSVEETSPRSEYLSPSHTRTSIHRLIPRVGDVFLSNRRQPLLKLVEDTSPGYHDTLIAACDPRRYEILGAKDPQNHGSCAQNLMAALRGFKETSNLAGASTVGRNVSVEDVPAPLNLFMNIPWSTNGNLNFESCEAKPGDYVLLRALEDVVVVLSACPMDMNAINGKGGPKDAHFVLIQ